ncbi:MAG: hypothetical protein D6706_17360, partial [Chloroflexi bacterium]
QIQAWLETEGVDGIEYPLRVYLTLIDVFMAGNQMEAARHLLNEATSYVQAQTTHMGEETQINYLQNHPLHRQLYQRIRTFARANTPPASAPDNQ